MPGINIGELQLSHNAHPNDAAIPSPRLISFLEKSYVTGYAH
jgi:hypothetical protein